MIITVLRLLLLLLLGFGLLPLAARAQGMVSGRVVDVKTGTVVPGATILQTGTTNGTPSDVEGYFRLTVLESRDSISLSFSSIGYITQKRRVAAGADITIRLVIDEKHIECLEVAYPLLEVGLSSGVRYAPFGGTIKLHGQRLLRLPITAGVGYQTNFSHNHAATVSLGLPALRQRNLLTITESLDYQFLQATPAAIRFSSYTATVGVAIYRIGPVRLPTILLGGGYARLASLAPEATVSVAGYGYLLGVSSSRLPLNFVGTAQATHWPDYWQWQAKLLHPFGRGFQTGVAFNQLRQYKELSVLVSRAFY